MTMAGESASQPGPESSGSMYVPKLWNGLSTPPVGLKFERGEASERAVLIWVGVAWRPRLRVPTGLVGAVAQGEAPELGGSADCHDPVRGSTPQLIHRRGLPRNLRVRDKRAALGHNGTEGRVCCSGASR
jgi:hypothetical protein